MKFTTNNILVSLTTALADYVKSQGYDVLWKATGETDPQTLGGTTKATVTFTPSMPANPAYIVRLKSDSAGPEEVVVPVLALQVPTDPKRIDIMGLGHKDYLWERDVRVDLFAMDEFQQREMADLLHDWLNSEEYKEFPILDYAANPAAPPALGNCRVEFALVERQELIHEVEAIRYYVKASAVISYIE